MKALLFLSLFSIFRFSSDVDADNLYLKVLRNRTAKINYDENSFTKLIGSLTYLKNKIDSSNKHYNNSLLKNLVGTDSITFHQMVSWSLASVMELNNIRLSFNSVVSQDYLNDIEDDADLIEQVNFVNQISLSEIRKVELVNSDLKTKRQYADNRKEAPLSDISVIARTKNYTGNEVSNYEVWFVVEKFKDKQSKYRSFDTVSSPTNRSMSPGNYFFWTKSREKKPKESKQQFHEVNDRSPEVKIDVSTDD